MKLLVATANPHKLKEIRTIFCVPSVELVSLADFKGVPEVEEDGATFEANALKKAVTLALTVRLWTLADDSGLEVSALGGAPGVRSARYAGEPVNYAANNAKLLREMAGVTDRRACFRCVIALASPRGRAQVVEGLRRGRILTEPKGANGFGYDPVFVPDGYTETFAEMGPDVKNSISHRGAALRKAMETWGDTLAHEPPDWPMRR
jgi:XTP/dITP diphosphohydrolase